MPAVAWAAPNSPTILTIEGKNVVVGQTLYLNITTAITVTGNAEASKTIKIFRGATQIGTTTSDGAGAYSVDVALAAGSYSLTAIANDASGDSAPSTVASVTIDTTTPTGSATVQQTGWRTNQLYMCCHNLIYANFADAGGSGLDFATVAISIFDNTSGTAVAGTQNHNGVDRVDFVPTAMGDTKIHGHSYTITASIQDNAGNLRTVTRSYFYDAVSPAPPTISKIYDPTHNTFTGTAEPGTNTPDGFGYVDYYPNMTINANPTNFKGNITPFNTYNNGYETWSIFESSQYCDWCANCTVDNGCIDAAGNFTWVRGATQYFPEGIVNVYFYSRDSTNLLGGTTLTLRFGNGTPQVPTSTAPYNGGEFNIIGSRTVPTITGTVTASGTKQTAQVYMTGWWSSGWWGSPWYNQSQVVLPAGQNYTNTAGVYNEGDAFVDANQNFQWDAGEAYVDSSSGGVSDGVSFSLPNISSFEFAHNGLSYLVVRSGNTYGASTYRGVGRFHNNDTYPPTLDDVILSPLDDQPYLRNANRPTSIVVKEHNWGYDWHPGGYGLNTATSKVEVLNNLSTVVSTQPTSWVYEGSLKYNGTLNTVPDAYPEGKYTLKVTLIDNLTNQTVNTSNWFMIDNTAPNVANVVPGNGTVSSIPSFNADINDPNLADGTTGSGAVLDLTLNQIDPYKRLGLANATATNSLTVPIDVPVGGQSVDHRGTVFPIGTTVQVWNTATNEIVGLVTIGNSTASNATITANAGNSLSVNMTVGALTIGTNYLVMYQIPHFDSNDGVKKVAAVPTLPSIAAGFYATRITGFDRAGNNGTTIAYTSIQLDPPTGTITLTPTPATVYILNAAPNERSQLDSSVIQGLSGTIVPDGTLVTVSLTGTSGSIVEPDANGVAADGFQIATAANGAAAGRIRFHLKAVDTVTFGTMTVNVSIGSATGTADVVMARPKVAISKAADVTTRNPGQVITYTITYTNSGNSVSNTTTIKDRLPNTVTYVAGSTKLNGVVQADGTVFNAGSGPSGEITVNAGSIAASGTGTVVFQVTVK